MDPRAQAVIDFWFGPEPHAANRKEWFQKDDAFDAQIRERFGALIEVALAGGLREWDPEPVPALARIVLLDQFTRNSFRGSARAFAGDALALAAARALVESGADLQLPPSMRRFVYLPFEHSEDLAMQAESMLLFTQLAAQDPSLADLVKWARAHQVIIERFGRFPHRNAVLGRPSTPDETEFLQQPGSSF
jgi:uncharacterized protein (DUF924 family)